MAADISDIIYSFYNKGTKRRRNDFTKDGRLYFHGNCIAILLPDGIAITTCGWDTLSTRGRLNQLKGVSVYRRKKQLYCNGSPWDGKFKKI